MDHRGKLLSWTFGGKAAEAYGRLGRHYSGKVYPGGKAPIDWTVLNGEVDTELVSPNSSPISENSMKCTTAPEGMVPFVLGASEGERMLAGEQLYTILGNQTHSNGQFIALLTEGPIGPAIPRHQHEKVTELFHCLNGQMEMYVGEGFVTLDPGDFLHVPPKTPHSFQLKKHDTRFLGFVTPGHFESFFRYLCEPFDGYRYPLVPPPFRFDRVIQHLAELDLTILERPSGPPPRANRENRRLRKMHNAERKVRVITDQVYSRAGGVDRLADAYIPGSEVAPPVVLWLHGGGWRFGDRHLAPDLAAFAKRSGWPSSASTIGSAMKQSFPQRWKTLRLQCVGRAA